MWRMRDCLPNAGLLGLAAMLLLAGCSDTTEESKPGGPGDPGLAGRYALETPFTAFEGRVESEGGDFDLRVVATEGTLELVGDSTYEQQLRFQTFIDGQLAGQSRWTDRGDWRARGDTLHFDSGYIGGLAFRGVKGDRRVRVLQDLVGEGVVAEYPFRRQQAPGG